MCGIQKAETIWTALQAKIAQYPGNPAAEQSYDQFIQEERNLAYRIGELKRTIADIDREMAALTGLEEQLVPASAKAQADHDVSLALQAYELERQSLENIIRELEGLRGINVDYSAQQAAWRAAAETLRRLMPELSGLPDKSADRPVIEMNLLGAQTAAETAERLRSQHQLLDSTTGQARYCQTYSEYTRLGGEIKQRKGIPAALATMDARVVELRDKMSELRVDIKTRTVLLQGKCPTCAHCPEEREKDAARAQLLEMDILLRQAGEMAATVEQEYRRLQEADRELSRLTAQQEQYAAELESTPADVRDFDPFEYKKRYEELMLDRSTQQHRAGVLQQQLRELDQLMLARTRLESQIKAANATMVSTVPAVMDFDPVSFGAATHRMQEIETQRQGQKVICDGKERILLSAKAVVAGLLGRVVPDVTYNQQQADRALHATHTTRRIQEAANLAALEQQQLSNRPNGEYMKKMASESKAARKFAASLEKVRTIFHRENFPRLLLSQKRDKINIKLADYLAEFNFPYQVHLEADGEFTYDADDFYHIPVAKLSGGERVVAAIAFILSLAEIAGGSFPVIVFDEPTANLDAGYREVLSSVLGKAGELLGRRGMMLIVPTHDPSVLSMAENVIDMEELT